MNGLLKKTLCIALGYACLASHAYSSDDQVLRHIKEVSRDYYYIHIDKPAEPFQIQDIVGGEHENQYHILGFWGERFSIAIESTEGKAGYSLRGEGFNIIRTDAGDKVEVNDTHLWITIAVSAHPYAQYILTVKKHDK
ncbi:hypothetical protein L4D76_04155 [Photobacterium sagamiensis]|uniref:hypothetical protein n=1 Tax=Photobacterium sagamiensis TaxID=2910241 RepID=UPI003D0F47E0